MKLIISTSIITLIALSAVAGVMPEDIQATASVIVDSVDVASSTEVINPEAQSTFKEQLDGLIQFAFYAIFILL